MAEKHHNHRHEHSLCIATIVYNIAVLLLEVLILVVFLGSSSHEVVRYEWIMQAIHLGGTVILGLVTWWWTHQWEQQHEKSIVRRPQQTVAFVKISSIMFLVHIIVLHVIPRLVGISLHHEVEHGGDNHEYMEYVVLMVIIIFITCAFWLRERFLQYIGIAGKYTIILPASIGRMLHSHGNQHGSHHGKNHHVCSHHQHAKNDIISE